MRAFGVSKPERSDGEETSDSLLPIHGVTSIIVW